MWFGEYKVYSCSGKSSQKRNDKLFPTVSILKSLWEHNNSRPTSPKLLVPTTESLTDMNSSRKVLILFIFLCKFASLGDIVSSYHGQTELLWPKTAAQTLSYRKNGVIEL